MVWLYVDILPKRYCLFSYFRIGWRWIKKSTPDSYGGIVLARAYWKKKPDSGSGLNSAWIQPGRGQSLFACPSAAKCSTPYTPLPNTFSIKPKIEKPLLLFTINKYSWKNYDSLSFWLNHYFLYWTARITVFSLKQNCPCSKGRLRQTVPPLNILCFREKTVILAVQYKK